MKKYAVVTDSLHPEFFFPIWHNYYARLFGQDSIHILTYGELDKLFNKFTDATVSVIHPYYDESARALAISDYVDELLKTHETVIRVDSDEFLVPSEPSAGNLKDFLEDWQGDYLTAIGFNIVQRLGQPNLNLNKPVIEQRTSMFASMSLNKTAVTRVSLRWGRGFHYCDQVPQLGGLWMLHLKHIDMQCKEDWARYMMAQSDSSTHELQYYSKTLRNIPKRHRERSEIEDLELSPQSSVMQVFTRQYLDAIERDPKTGLFQGNLDACQHNFKIPEHLQHWF